MEKEKIKVRYWFEKIPSDEIWVEAYFCPFCHVIILNDPIGLNAFPNCPHYVDFDLDENKVILQEEL